MNFFLEHIMEGKIWGKETRKKNQAATVSSPQFSILSNDRSKAFSKIIPPHSAV